MNRIKLNGIIDILSFTALLRNNKIWYTLYQVSDDYISVRIDIINRRIEIDFYEDRIEYNYFDGHEDILTDQTNLFDMLKHFVNG